MDKAPEANQVEARQQRRYLEGALPRYCFKAYRRLVLFLLCFLELTLILFLYTSVLLDHWTASAGLDVAPWVYWSCILAPALVLIFFWGMVSCGWLHTRVRQVGWAAAILYNTVLLFIMLYHVVETLKFADQDTELLYLLVMAGAPLAVLLLSIHAYYLTVPRGGDKLSPASRFFKPKA